MKKVTLVLVCSLFSAAIMAQKIYFVYLQTENQQPFFVRMNEKVYSSTASGYLILSKLIDSNYNFKIGFPRQNMDLNFSTVINKKDHGYLLRNFGDKGWGLIDLQTLSIQMSKQDEKAAANINLRLDTNINAFTELLSKAADDTTLKYVSIVQEEEKKPEQKRSDIIQPVVKVEIPASTNHEEKTNQGKTEQPEKKPELVKNEPVVEKKEEVVKSGQPEEKKAEIIKTEPEKKPEIVTEAPYKKSEVTRIGQSNVVDGVEIVYSDKQPGKTDTIRIVIDQPKAVAKSEEKAEEKKSEKKFLDISSDSVKTTSEMPVIEKKDPGISVDSSSVKSNQSTEKKEEKKFRLFSKNKGEKKCDVADNNDFLKLRRKMAAKTNDDGMIEEASKYFKSKCFTTEQIKNLSSMFLSNAGKYHFFNAAYEYVADKENFTSLQSELKDDYYLNRFKALVQN